MATRAAKARDGAGRATRDPEGTKRRILAAALDEFAAKGIDGARVDAIAQRAGVNKRMLYYYFGAKDDLYRAVLRDGLSEQSPAEAPARHVGEQRVAELADRMARAPQYIRLLSWEALERGNRRRVEDEARRRERLRRWIDEVEEAQAAGALPAELDAAQLVLAELALAVFPLAFPQVTRLVTGHGPTDARFVEQHRRFVTALASRVDGTRPA